MLDQHILKSELIKVRTSNALQDTVSGGGEMGKLLRAHDWSQTALGPMNTWPQSLLTAVSIVIASKFPIILFWGEKLSVIYNDAYIPIFGAKHPHILGKTGYEAWGEVWDVIYPMFEQVRNKGEATWSEDQLLLLTRNNYLEECYFTWSYSPIRDETGKVAGVLTPITETTKRVLSERRMATLRELGNKVLNSKTVNDACRITCEVFAGQKHDIPFSIVYLADTTRKKLIFKASSGFNDGVPEIFDQELILDSNHSTNFLTNCLENNCLTEINQLEQVFGKLPGGAWPESPRLAIALPINASEQNLATGILLLGINPRRAFDDDYHGFVELLAGQVSRAIASARAYEEEIKRAEMLLEIDKAKTVFFSNVSHEFRTPLTLMLGPLEDSLEDSQFPLNSKQKDRQTLIYRNTLRLLKLVNSLLDFSRIEANRIQAIYEPTDLAQLTANLASCFDSTLEKAQLKYTVDIAPIDEPVYVDKEMWEKIIFNLLSNAFKFTLKGEIKVLLRKLASKVELRVQDTGTGIPEQELPKLFERFHRIEGTKGRSFEGTGIGLALIKELIKLHGGSIEVESKENEGSTFIGKHLNN